MIGYGKQLNNIKPYDPIYFSGDLCWQFKPGRKKVFLTYYCQPQFNFVKTDGPMEVEFGSNIGLRFYQYVGENLVFYQMAGSGPHFITANLKRQARGFIFSDDVAIGFLKKINKRSAINFQIKLRHISNAGLKRPNAGVNTLNVLIGLVRIKGGNF